MAEERKIGMIPNVPAGDEETAKHPANDAVLGATGGENANEPRDRKARLAQDAGSHRGSTRSDSSDDGRPYLQRRSGPERSD